MGTLPIALFICALYHIGSVNGYAYPTEDPTRVARADPATATPLMTFNTVSEMTSCGIGVISWMYTAVTSSDPLEMTLSITNEGVAQPPAPSTTSTGEFHSAGSRRATNRRDDSITQQIAAGIDPEALVYTWASVNVASGWYTVFADMPLLPGFVQESNSFFVAAGNNTSCLASTSSSSSSSLSSSTTPNPTSTGSPTSTGAAETTSGTPAVLASTSKVNRGAIAGGVIGGLAVVAAAIAAFFYLRYASASTASVGSPRKRGTRKWAGLGSTDSKARAYPSAPRSPGAVSGRHHSQSDSIGPILSSHDNNVYVIGAVGIDSRPSRINDALEEDEVNSYFSPSQEKISSPSNGSPIRSPFSESGHGHDDAVPLDYITPLPGNTIVTRNSSTSTSSYMNSNFSRPRSHPNSPYASPTTTEGPFHDNASSSLGQEGSYPPTPSPAFPSGTSQTEMVPVRRSSTGEPIAAPTRRTPRKPVPQYNPTDPALTSPPPSVPSPLPPCPRFGQ
ncbi:hypothetical protein MSAN_02198900 [Mycena sanguinolenta]|uniref:Uncharacterized protein n=1 Tax=Mycena sanguinolenta TaxID=230812 RepID=A0A8H6XE19_9AGAR|nr:hypothetical protein MSAN_02198900 [Mycena sanguinolenta]